MSAVEVRIPDIGDAEDVEVVEICVSVGDVVARDAPLIVIESDKASMEVPSPFSGRVARIEVKLGDKVGEGQLIALVEGDAGEEAGGMNRTHATSAEAAAAATTAAATAAATTAAATTRAQPAAESSPPPVRRLEVRLPDVGDAKDVKVVEIAVEAGAAVRRDDLLLVVESDKASMEVPAPADGRIVEVAVANGTEVAEGSLLVVMEAAGAPADVVEPGTVARAEVATPVRTAATPPDEGLAATRGVEATTPAARSVERVVSDAAASPGAKVYAGPAVRRLARELGVDLAAVEGTGARGRIVKEDVQRHVKARLGAVGERAPAAGIPRLPEVDFAKFGPVEVVPLTRIRRRGAANLHRAWLNVVHVTQHDEADVTDLEAFRQSLKADATARGVKLTPLAFVLRALVPVLKAYPTFNASLDAGVENLVLKRYVNIGFAVDTPEGLVVPVVHDADQKGVFELAEEIERLSARARDGKLAPAEISGGSFTVSSLGAIGGTGFTPIVNAPEVAILGVSRLATKPHWNGQAFEPRQFLPVSLSYDHRAINGAEAGRFVTAFCETLRDLRRALL